MRKFIQILALGLAVMLFSPAYMEAGSDAIHQPTWIVMNNGQIEVNGQPFGVIRGVTYAPMPWRTFLDPVNPASGHLCYINTPNQCPTPSPSYTCTNDELFDFLENFNTGAYQRDLPLIKLMGANVIRVYSSPTSGLLQAAKANGLMIFDTSHVIWDEDFTFTNNLPRRQQIINDFVARVTNLKNDPNFDAVLGFSFSWENDIRFCDHINYNCTPQQILAQAQGFYQLANDAIAAAKLALTDEQARIFTIVTGAFDYGIPRYIGQPGIADDAIMSDLDFWSGTVFWGTDFGVNQPPWNNLFSGYTQTPTSKPFFVSGFGLDGFHVNNSQNPTGGYSDPITQGRTVCNLWEEIRHQTAVPQSFVLGGVLETWTDAWGFAYPGNLCSALTKDPNVGYYSPGMPDQYLNREDLGINDLIPDTTMSFQDGVQYQWGTLLMYHKWNSNIQCP